MTVSVGLRGEAAVTVDQRNTAIAMGSGNVPVFATPALIALMERAAVNALRRHLDEGEDSVGVAVAVRHLAPTPVGKRVRAEAEVTAVEGRRVTFAVRAFDAVEKVGEGTHERMLVDREGFMWKVASKGA
jgi:predicted thioesterase